MNGDQWPDDEVEASIRNLPSDRLEEWTRYATGAGKGLTPEQLGERFHPNYLRDNRRFVCFGCGERAVFHTREEVGKCIARWMVHVLKFNPSGPLHEPAKPAPTAARAAAATEIPLRDRLAVYRMRAAREREAKAGVAPETKATRHDRGDRVNPFIVSGTPARREPLKFPYGPKDGDK
jgi:hypothetical protein